MKDTDRREQVAEEIATKLYERNVKDVRQLIDVMIMTMTIMIMIMIMITSL
jgi:hypothetical protein